MLGLKRLLVFLDHHEDIVTVLQQSRHQIDTISPIHSITSIIMEQKDGIPRHPILRHAISVTPANRTSSGVARVRSTPHDRTKDRPADIGVSAAIKYL